MIKTYKFLKIKILLLVILLTPYLAIGQLDSIYVDIKEPSTWSYFKNDGLLMFGGIKHAYSRPLQWKKKDWLTASGIVFGTAALNLIDDDAYYYFTKQEKKIPSLVKDFGWYFGSPQNNYGVTGSIYLYGLFTKNTKIRKTGILMISSASAAGLIQTFSKTIAGRARPTGENKLSFNPFSNEPKYHSFPSGHTILSFTTFYALSKQFENPWIKAGFYTVGLISPISRLWHGAHWLTDVALSMAITIVVVDSIDNYLDKEMGENPLSKIKKDKNKISWSFKVGAGGFGLMGNF